jgi:hypothetical protein
VNLRLWIRWIHSPHKTTASRPGENSPGKPYSARHAEPQIDPFAPANTRRRPTRQARQKCMLEVSREACPDSSLAVFSYNSHPLSPADLPQEILFRDDVFRT